MSKVPGISRRAAVTGLLYGSASLRAATPTSTESAVPVASPSLSSPFPFERLISELAVTSGPYEGAYRSMPNGPINWYFANLGLWFFVNSAPDRVRRYLDVYLRAMDPVRASIQDIAPDLTTPVHPDSDDAYAGALLRLAVAYAKNTGDATWWKANLSSLKKIANANLLTQIKPNGLVRAFQAPASNGIGYLMDQCEVYAGLRDFGQYLFETNDPDARYYSAFAVNLGIAIHSLYDPKQKLWKWCDVATPPGNAWYPNLTAQIYPHLYDVHGTDAPTDYARLHAGYRVLEKAAPDWSSRPQDLYPWLVVGYYAAACLNRADLAAEMVEMVRRYYLPGSVNTGRFLISEIGYVAGIETASAVSESCRRNPLD
jgi:hypothetical protein